MVLYIRLCHPSTTILTSFGADLVNENNEQHIGCKFLNLVHGLCAGYCLKDDREQ